MPLLHQFIFNQVSSKNSHYLASTIFRAAQKLLLKISNPVIQTELYGFPFMVPFSHDLPKNLQKHSNYSWNLLAVAKWVNSIYPNTPLIDVGANVGDTVALLRTSLQNPILCIEGNQSFFDLLQVNKQQFSQVTAVQQLLGDVDSVLKSELAIKNGTAQVKNSAKSQNIKTLENVLNSYPEFMQAKLVKIDTDGFDGFILRGAISWIKKQQPYVFLEFDPYFLAIQQFAPTEIFSILTDAAYKYVAFFDNYGNYLKSLKIKDSADIQSLIKEITGFQATRYYDLLFIPDENLMNFPY